MNQQSVLVTDNSQISFLKPDVSRGSATSQRSGLFGQSAIKEKRKASLPVIKMPNKRRSLSLLFDEPINEKNESATKAQTNRFKVRNLSLMPSPSGTSMLPKQISLISPRANNIINSARQEAAAIDGELSKTLERGIGADTMLSNRDLSR